MPKTPDLSALKKFVRKIAPHYLKQPNVTSVGLGYKEQAGKPTGQISIQFTVGKKVGLEALESAGAPVLPGAFVVGGVKVPTDVLERTYEKSAKPVQILAPSGRKRAIDPVVPGVSIGHRDITAGTAGCVVYGATSGERFILSNWHVLHGPTGKLGDPIVQPGRFDDNRVDRNVAGRLVRSHLGPAGDCAICTIEGRNLEPRIIELGVAVERIGEPELGDRVIKSGRTTDVTHGIVKRIHVTTRIDYGGSTGFKEIGGFEIGPDPAKPAPNGEISMGGDSGATWLSVERGRATTQMLGLHFGGEVGDAPEHALACYAASVFEKLEIRPTRPAAIAVEEKLAPLGYAETFLGAEVPLPRPSTATVRNDLVKVDGNPVIAYMHFSLAMSRARRFARWVAWNIDGSSTRRLPRKGIPFRKDPKVPADVQVGDELYAGNRLDRGHIARRQDLLWGPLADAQRANVDSFYFTNMTPQHERFNQSGSGGIWGSLENAIFSDCEVHDLRLSVLGGPILQPGDEEYRGVQLPRDFWKIIYFRETAAGPVRAKGYVLTQKNLLNQIEALELDEFKVFEVSIEKIGNLIDLILPEATTPETLPRSASRSRQPESADASGRDVRLVTSVREIVA